jgi:S-formylglutathione hydrolase FrmB
MKLLRFAVASIVLGWSAVLAASAQGETKPPAMEIVNGCRIERFEVSSPTMGRSIRAWAILPPNYEQRESLPLLIALHGRAAPYDTWAKMPLLQRGLAQKPMIVAGFDGDAASWYLDSPLKRESRFETYFFDEYLPSLNNRYRISDQKPAITGFSMGGFGAMHFALKRPEMFASVSALSGAFRDLEPPSNVTSKTIEPLLGAYLENPAVYRAINLWPRLALVKQPSSFPSIYLECGTEDNLLETNRDFYSTLKKHSFGAAFHESSGGHNWEFWSSAAARILDFHWAEYNREKSKP